MRAAVAALLAAVVLSSCSFGNGADKSGGDGPPVTLRMATSDQPGSHMVPAFELFADSVEHASEGRLRVEVTYAAQGDQEPKFDQVVAGLVQRGDYDLALVPARGWDDLGVSSMRALQAPFLVDSDELVDEIVTGELAGSLMSGLPAAGVQGLVLWPEALRHPVGFGRHRLLSLQDFAGARLRAPYSRDVYALLEALGSEPVDLDRSGMNAAYAAGRVDGAESGSDRATFVAPATITADVTLYAKIDAVVANDDVWDDLTPDQRAILSAAAQRARDWLVVERPVDNSLLAEACEIGAGVSLAGPPAVAAIRRAGTPLLERMRQDPEVGPVIEKLEALKADLVRAPFPPPVCELADEQTDIGPRIDPAILDGTYRTSFTVEELRAAGDDPNSVENNAGLWTITLDGGRYTDVESDCTATYAVSATMLAFRWDTTGGCTASGNWTARWELTSDGLRFIDVQSPYAGDRAIWGLHEWLRLEP